MHTESITAASEAQRAIITSGQQLVLKEQRQKTDTFAKCTWEIIKLVAELRLQTKGNDDGRTEWALRQLYVVADDSEHLINSLKGKLSRVFKRMLTDSADRAFWNTIDVRGLVMQDLIELGAPFDELKRFYRLERNRFEEHARRWIQERCEFKQAQGAKKANQIGAEKWKRNLLDEVHRLNQGAPAATTTAAAATSAASVMSDESSDGEGAIAGTVATPLSRQTTSSAASAALRGLSDAGIRLEVNHAASNEEYKSDLDTNSSSRKGKQTEEEAKEPPQPRLKQKQRQAKNKKNKKRKAQEEEEDGSSGDEDDVDDVDQPPDEIEDAPEAHRRAPTNSGKEPFDARMLGEADLGEIAADRYAKPVEIGGVLPHDLQSQPSVQQRLDRDGFVFLQLNHEDDHSINFVRKEAYCAESTQVWCMPSLGPVAMEPDRVVASAQVPKELSDFPRRQPPTDTELLKRYIQKQATDVHAAMPASAEMDDAFADAGRMNSKHVPLKDTYFSVKHPLNLDTWADSAASIVRFVPLLRRMEGFAKTWGYKKVWTNYFRAHVEQLYAGFVHHVLVGCILWHLVRPTAKHDKLPGENRRKFLWAIRLWLREPGVAPEFAHLALQDHCMSTEEWLDAILLLLHQKRLYPDVDFLRRHGVEVISLKTKANQVLIGGEGLVHWGINAAPYTSSLAVNFMTEGWLQRGLPQLQEHLCWLERIRVLRWRLLNDPATKACAGVLFDTRFDTEYLNLVPPTVCCEMLQKLAAVVDPTAAQHASTRSSAFPFQLFASDPQRTQLQIQLLRVQGLLHAAETTKATGTSKEPGLQACECELLTQEQAVELLHPSSVSASPFSVRDSARDGVAAMEMVNDEDELVEHRSMMIQRHSSSASSSSSSSLGSPARTAAAAAYTASPTPLPAGLFDETDLLPDFPVATSAEEEGLCEQSDEPKSDEPSNASDLTPQEWASILSGACLYDAILDVAGRMLRHQYADRLPKLVLRYPVVSLHPPANARRAPLQAIPLDSDVLQMLHIKGNHFVVVLTEQQQDGDHCPRPRNRLVLDSLYDHPVEQDPDLLQHLRDMFPASVWSEELGSLVQRKIPQRQTGSTDCGCFVIAWAVLWCEGTDPCSVQLEQGQLRPWIDQCLRTGKFSSPPRQGADVRAAAMAPTEDVTTTSESSPSKRRRTDAFISSSECASTLLPHHGEGLAASSTLPDPTEADIEDHTFADSLLIL